jgi:sporulation protein YlmC with PRC-barrel domain
MNAQSNDAKLEKPRDSDLVLAEGSQDIRDRKVLDSEGTAIGHVSALFVDEPERKVRMIELRVGDVLGLGGTHVLLPVDAITEVTRHEVRVDQTRDRVINSPAYDPKLILRERNDWNSYYGYYGYSPYWNTGYRYPDFGIWP